MYSLPDVLCKIFVERIFASAQFLKRQSQRSGTKIISNNSLYKYFTQYVWQRAKKEVGAPCLCTISFLRAKKREKNICTSGRECKIFVHLAESKKEINVCVCMRRCICTCICVCVYMCTSGRRTNILHSTSGRETALCKMYVSLPLHNFFFALCQMYSFEKLCRGKEHLLRLDLATL